MRLVKCNQCGRPYYDSEDQCPYCAGSPSSADDAPLTIPEEAHNEVPEQVAESEPELVAEPVPEPVAALEAERPRRAAAMADIVEREVEDSESPFDASVGEADTTPLPRRRRGWLWVVVVVLLLAAAAAVYLEWDLIASKIAAMKV